MTEVLWKTLTLTTGPYFFALGTKANVNSPGLNTINPGSASPHSQEEQKHHIPRDTGPYGQELLLGPRRLGGMHVSLLCC